MRRCSAFVFPYHSQVLSYHRYLGSVTKHMSFFSYSTNSAVAKRSCLTLTAARPFPDYSPKKPSVRDFELVQHVSTSIKQRYSEHVRRVLKPFESKIKPDHIVWVLMTIKNDYKLVIDFFDWWCQRRDPSIEVRCIIVHIAAAQKDARIVHRLIHDFWARPSVDVTVFFPQFLEKLIYTYKDWGSNPFVFDIFFQVLVELGSLDYGRKLFDKMLHYGLVLSVSSCNFFLSRLSHEIEGHKMMLKVFNEFSEVGVCWDNESHNIVIHSLCRIGKVKEAHNLLLQMELRGCMPDVVSYSTVINGYCAAGQLESVMKIIEEMQVKGLKPNAFTFNSIILLLSKRGKVHDAEKILREMTSQRITADNVVYTTLIDGFCKTGNISAAYGLFNEMQSLNISPDLITYTTLISGLCQTGNIVEADKLLNYMLGRGLEPDEFIYTTLIDGYCKAGEIRTAFSLHNKMVQMQFVPNIVTYTTLVDGLCKLGELETANELLQEMCGKGLELNIYTYNSLVNGFCKAGDVNQALKLMEDMEAAGMLQEGDKLLKWMLEKGIIPNATTYNSLMKQYSVRNNMCMTSEIYKGMLDQGVVPNANTFNILIRGHCKARNMKEAWFLHKEMIKKGFTPTLETYHALIKGFLRRKKYSEAKELFEEMRRYGLLADKEFYSIFADMNYELGNFDLALELCDEAVEKCLTDKTDNRNA
ncbi:pentatricopeptide repeat-containing protein At1g05670, mitochondrial isoform X2 [Solanum pennellii]|uniref:Pentatricopeptide repeat-containing protein At1g05670, mitochondrial isoform X2 n=1 Tax=Solanum pennellii TaxID=28526 RepID=A0ABM1GV18_SOLPN|nr:pentatricopeptide repeat-containing protein At1g05670, mitochondrial isoform X2 [Solanum pennellii]